MLKILWGYFVLYLFYIFLIMIGAASFFEALKFKVKALSLDKLEEDDIAGVYFSVFAKWTILYLFVLIIQYFAGKFI